ncbi:copper homeostasis protein CutC [Bullifex porci]|uniref:copper homeostasis protein CutC n=1 Tax=Bullifex porci TaxID=2606638 RepID=UPI0023EFE3D3|nr:copper homeostasis protein CutC [Bullifex porci]MDD7256468.1 copper homeostasis protein CutC [Bullifex porci]MDD7587931.1 copper homeostasis protein CutC [Bullifex porci]MDY2742070.1 copper homeostasis protein CutC [Bullifex porci]
MVDRPIIEICLESVESVIAAEKGGADRVELCSDLFEGGLTPTIGTVKTALKKSNIKINAMIRPRGGDFCYSDEEFEVMKEDIKAFKETGINGIVFGILTPEGDVDVKRSKEIIELARPLAVTFHRAFDMTRDPYKSLEELIELGVDRVLTSGQEATVPEGADLLEELVQIAGDRIIVMPGCGITERNFPKLRDKIKAKEYHIYLPYETTSKMKFHPGHIYMGGLLRQSEFTITHTSSSRVSDVMGTL